MVPIVTYLCNRITCCGVSWRRHTFDVRVALPGVHLNLSNLPVYIAALWSLRQEEKNRCRQAENKEDEDDRGEEKPRPDPDLEAGKTLPARYGEFPPDLYGKPIEDIDDYYHNKYVSNNQFQ